MGGRYYVTGVQLGMLIAFLHEGKTADAFKLVDEILDRQFMFMVEVGLERDKFLNKLTKSSLFDGQKCGFMGCQNDATFHMYLCSYHWENDNRILDARADEHDKTLDEIEKIIEVAKKSCFTQYDDKEARIRADSLDLIIWEISNLRGNKK